MAVAKKKKVKKNIVSGVAHVLATFNNTRITVTDMQGNVVAWATAGGQGFKGAKKSTPYAAQITADVVARKGMEMGLQNIDVKVRGAGGGGEAAIRGLGAAGLKVGAITNITKIPHNGCRPKKARRV
ncbi:MAG: 30S ribosomal protein S11 [Alphaproteobacteria bacterium]|nr:30S ribosomal protein S11 [Alphaproteobacteria bacterium]MBN2780229.1 30S ribosomal protein S11 [Alphaproteobacteria bacterium]